MVGLKKTVTYAQISPKISQKYSWGEEDYQKVDFRWNTQTGWGTPVFDRGMMPLTKLSFICCDTNYSKRIQKLQSWKALNNILLSTMAQTVSGMRNTLSLPEWGCRRTQQVWLIDLWSWMSLHTISVTSQNGRSQENIQANGLEEEKYMTGMWQDRNHQKWSIR